MESLPRIERRPDLTAAEFFASYVGKKPVVLAGLVSGWRAVRDWSPEWWRTQWPELRVKVKRGDVIESDYVEMPMSEYVAALERADQPLYLHNFALLHAVPALLGDVQPFPSSHLPAWYGQDFWRPMQFFYGPRGSGTPLHFDGYGTHGFLFQVSGRKRIVFIDAKDRDKCYMTRFFWSDADAESPDFTRHPRMREVVRTECITEPGDLVYWPPFTLHQVRNLEASASFSLEWHDRKSVAKSLTVIDDQHPLRMLRLNVAHALGLYCRIPKRYVYPAYRFYFDSPRKRAGTSPRVTAGAR